MVAGVQLFLSEIIPKCLSEGIKSILYNVFFISALVSFSIIALTDVRLLMSLAACCYGDQDGLQFLIIHVSEVAQFLNYKYSLAAQSRGIKGNVSI